MHLFKLQIVFDQNANCICAMKRRRVLRWRSCTSALLRCQMCSRLFAKCICLNCKWDLSKMQIVFVQNANCICEMKRRRVLRWRSCTSALLRCQVSSRLFLPGFEKPNRKMYLFKLQIVFVEIHIYLCNGTEKGEAARVHCCGVR